MSEIRANTIQNANGDGAPNFPKGLTVGGTLAVTGASTFTGQALASDGTASAPGIAFSADTDTGLFRSASDQVDIVTNGASRFRIESTGQIKAVYESTVGTDYNTTLDNGYFCRAWLNYKGNVTRSIRGSGNVSSVTAIATGNFQVNFTTNMPDVNYAVLATIEETGVTVFNGYNSFDNNVAYCKIFTALGTSGNGYDPDVIAVAVFR